jgi:hypothetical protein
VSVLEIPGESLVVNFIQTVQTSVSNLPMLEVLGSLDSHRLKKAVAVVIATEDDGAREARLQQAGLARLARP